jgi:uncharacterized C2H2 Zn-finger protein
MVKQEYTSEVITRQDGSKYVKCTRIDQTFKEMDDTSKSISMWLKNNK